MSGAETTYKACGDVQCDRGRDASGIRVQGGVEESIQGDTLEAVE